IPFELNRNKIILPLRVNDSRVLKVILDTGMPSKGAMLFDPKLSEEIELKNASRFQVRGAGKGETSYVLRDESVTLSLGDIEFSNQPLMILQNDRMSGFPTDGVVGNVLFGSSAVKIDYDSKLITLLDSDNLELDSGWVEIDMRFNESNIPFIDAAVSVSGDDQVDINIYIDSASSEALELLVKPEMKFQLPEQMEDQYLGRGLSGDIYGKVGHIKKFMIGSFTLFDVPTAFPKAEIRSRQDGADGILCNRALMRFNVVFDFEGKKLYIQPNKSFNLPFN
ncbi:MAG: aspartyl protease family protein, partial [Candidatus Aminicenantes bacterium]|nr:aspartyl protease family protein [Candidatus Aminicenantes bacterium]